MTVKERVLEAIHNWDCERDNVDKIIALAYYMGRESAAKEVCDKAYTIFDNQRKTAENSRYHNLAMKVQGNVTYIYHPDYSNTMTDMFCSDITAL